MPQLPCCNKHYAGVTLVELLVVLLISAIFSQQLLSLLSNFIVQYEVLEKRYSVDEGKQVGFLLFENFIKKAGYQEFSLDGSTSIFSANNEFMHEAVIYAKDNVTADKRIKSETDLISIRYQVPYNSRLRDCKNTKLIAGSVAVMDFFVDRENDLRCRGVPDKKGTRSSAIIAHRISDFQVEFAYIKKNTRQLIYCSAKCVSDNNLWKHVIAVRVVMSSLIDQTVEQENNLCKAHQKNEYCRTHSAVYPLARVVNALGV